MQKFEISPYGFIDIPNKPTESQVNVNTACAMQANLAAELLSCLEKLTDGVQSMQRKGLAAPDLLMVKNARAAIAKATVAARIES